MSENGSKKLRVALDVGLIMSLLGLAFYAGILTQQVADLREAVTTRGRVQISIEAAERLESLESNERRQDMRLDQIETELRRLAYQ